MANLLQSSQNKETTAPGYYTDYLSNLATQGKTAAGQAQYVGAQPLQEKAFCEAQGNFGAQQGALSTAQGIVGQAAGQDITGAAQPYLTAGTSASPLCAARPLICQSANLDLSQLASQYMNPYIQTAVQGMSDIAHRNIRQNLSPAATAAAVGSGQFGSQRGAQVLGQIQAQAEQCLNQQIANMENQGFAQALQAATAKQGALGQLANTTATAQQAQNQANLTAGSTAAQAAANEGQLLNTAGTNLGNLAQTGANMNLACINALSTLGGQQQTIAQNAQNFPLTKLQSLSSLLQGYSIPTGTKTTLCMSPFSAAAAIGAGGLGVVKNLPNIKKNLADAFAEQKAKAPLISAGGKGGGGGGINGLCDCTSDCCTDCCTDCCCTDCCCSCCDCCSWCCDCCSCCGCWCCCYAAEGGSIKAKTRGYTGCASTSSRGALPSKKG